jgi:hypothetical protein
MLESVMEVAMRRTKSCLVFMWLGALLVSIPTVQASGLPVHTAHPRLLLTPSAMAKLLAKKNANAPSWQALKSQADTLATYKIFPYKYATRSEEPPNTIFYDYQGSGWFDAAFPLAFAYKMTGNAKYSNKLLALADEMIRAQTDPDNLPPKGLPPLEPDAYYPTRYLGPVLALIYDWCYDKLGATRKAKMVALMNAYFDDLRNSTAAYQVNIFPDGNYFPNHMVAVAYMGYASFGDNPRAQQMIDWARMRFDGTPSKLVPPNNKPKEYVTQVFNGGIQPYITLDGGPNLPGAPWRGGFDFQGWSYGTQTLSALIDYLLAVQSATGEDLLTPRVGWFQQMFRALKHGLMPDQFKIVPAGDWGSDYGAVIFRSLPVRLAAVLAGTADGPGAQHFAYVEIAAHSPYPDGFPDWAYQQTRQQAAWEEFFFGDPARPSAVLNLLPYHSGFNPNDPAANRAIPYFYLRSDWSANATWAFLHMGAAWYNDHQHNDAGNLIVTHGKDQLLVDASNWKGAAGSEGILGSSFDEVSGHAGAGNTLWFNDFGDFQRSADALNGSEYYAGGQGFWGKDEVIAAEQTPLYNFVRSNLTSAYNRGGDPADQATRRLAAFFRTVVYLRPADIFLVYDQVQAVNSTNPLGPYRKYLRWHFPNRPTLLADNLVQVDKGTSRLYLRTLLPNPALTTAVDESNNLDPCEDRVHPIPAGCVSYNASGNWDANSGTWRIEVKHPSNPLTIDFLTLLQPGANIRPAPTGTALTTQDNKMRGARIVQTIGATTEVNVVLVNQDITPPITPVTRTSYTFSGPRATHLLGGMTPNARYRVEFANSLVTVTSDATGPLVASAQGILRFQQ